MARPPRSPGAGIPHHLTKRGHNREAICRSGSDFIKLRQLMLEGCATYTLRVHAYVLMGNHFHLLATPGSEFAHSQAIHWVAGTYARWFNVKYQRTGTLWEGRFWSAPIDSDEYFLNCQSYVELNPVRAGMVESPGDYPWSSFRCNASGAHDPLIAEHEVYLRLGHTSNERRLAYRSLVLQRHVEDDFEVLVREATRTGQPITTTTVRSQRAEKCAN